MNTVLELIDNLLKLIPDINVHRDMRQSLKDLKVYCKVNCNENPAYGIIKVNDIIEEFLRGLKNQNK